MAGAEGSQVVDDFSLLVHFLLDELGSLLGVEAGVEYEGGEVVRVLATEDYALLVRERNRYNS